MGQKITKGDNHQKILEVAVCGDPSAIKIYMDRKTALSTCQDGYILSIDVIRGNTSDGNVKDMDVDLYLCVYDVRDSNTMKFLSQNILPDVQAMGKNMAIAGLGVEYRIKTGPTHSSVHVLQKLADRYNCPASEIISSDPDQMAVGTYALYSATLSESLRNQLLSNSRIIAEGIELDSKKKEAKRTTRNNAEKSRIRKRI